MAKNTKKIVKDEEMSRISREMMFMQIAEVASRRSTCSRRNVGAVIVSDTKILSIGYNGPPSGEEHCTGKDCCDPKIGCTRSVHAEVNALDRVPRLVGGSWRMFVTESPCPVCASILAGSRVDEIYFLHQYRLTEGCEILVASGIKLYRMTPAGHIIDWKTGELL